MPVAFGVDIEEPTLAQLHSIPELVVAAAFLVMSWLAVLLRVYVRVVMIRSFGGDDWLCLISQVSFVSCLYRCRDSLTSPSFFLPYCAH